MPALLSKHWGRMIRTVVINMISSLPCFRVFVELQMPPGTDKEELPNDWDRSETNLERRKQAGGRASTRMASEESEDGGWSRADRETQHPLQVGREREIVRRENKHPSIPPRSMCKRL